MALLLICSNLPEPVTAQTACGFAVTATADVANKIAIGHAWTEHKTEFVPGAIFGGLAMPASPKVSTTAEFKAHVLTAMGSSVNKTLGGGRKAWWFAATGTFVVFNPADSDCGTAFRPGLGKSYYDNQT